MREKCSILSEEFNIKDLLKRLGEVFYRYQALDVKTNWDQTQIQEAENQIKDIQHFIKVAILPFFTNFGRPDDNNLWSETLRIIRQPFNKTDVTTLKNSYADHWNYLISLQEYFAEKAKVPITKNPEFITLVERLTTLIRNLMNEVAKTQQRVTYLEQESLKATAENKALRQEMEQLKVRDQKREQQMQAVLALIEKQQARLDVMGEQLVSLLHNK